MRLFCSNIELEPWKLIFKVFLFGLFLTSVEAQNQVEETFNANDINRIVIRGDQIFEIEILSENRNSILLSSLVDGEYGNDYQIKGRTIEDVLQIELQSANFSDIPDDKRNAHKVVAARLKLKLPHNMSVEIASDVGNVQAQGIFKSFLANLETGYFSLEGLSQYLKVKTIRGDIFLTTKDTEIEAYSANGALTIDEQISGANKTVLNSIRGNIKVEQLSN